MSTIDKLIKRFSSQPTDFSWSELEKLLGHFGYEELPKGKTGGSRRKFFNAKTGDLISMHKPHPKNILKHYQVKEILRKLKDLGHIK